MELALMIGADVLLAVCAAMVWTKAKGPHKAKDQPRVPGHLREREEIQIDPTKVSEFKPTWRESR